MNKVKERCSLVSSKLLANISENRKIAQRLLEKCFILFLFIYLFILKPDCFHNCYFTQIFCQRAFRVSEATSGMCIVLSWIEYNSQREASWRLHVTEFSSYLTSL